jgi:hypothetical protein
VASEPAAMSRRLQDRAAELVEQARSEGVVNRRQRR